MSTMDRTQRYLDRLRAEDELNIASASCHEGYVKVRQQVDFAWRLINPLIQRAVSSGDWSEVARYLDENGIL